MILLYVRCGHFALSTLLETCLEDAVFDINVRRQQITKLSKVQKCQIWHDNQKPYHQQILFCVNWEISTCYDTIFMRTYVLFNKKVKADMSKKGPWGIHSNESLHLWSIELTTEWESTALQDCPEPMVTSTFRKCSNRTSVKVFAPKGVVFLLCFNYF